MTEAALQIFAAAADPVNEGPLTNLNRVVQLAFGDVTPWKVREFGPRSMKDRIAQIGEGTALHEAWSESDAPILVQNDSEGVEIHTQHRGDNGALLGGSIYFKAYAGFDAQGVFALNETARSTHEGRAHILYRRADYKSEDMWFCHRMPELSEMGLISQFGAFIGENLPEMLPGVKAAMEKVFGKPAAQPVPKL